MKTKTLKSKREIVIVVLANSKREEHSLGENKDFVTDQLFELSEMIYDKGLDIGWGNAHEYGKDYKNNVFEMFPYHDCCSCGSGAKEKPHKEDCIGERPNFKCGDLEIRWYKYIGRIIASNRVVSTVELEEIFKKCKESLQ